MVVCLDAGHGFDTRGNRSPDNSYYEHEFALDMSLRIKNFLEKYGVKVILTRPDQNNTSLSGRCNISNKHKADIFVSLHSNASGNGKEWSSPRGWAIYTYSSNVNAKCNKLAQCIINEVKNNNIYLFGNSPLRHENFYVLRNTQAPAVLIEHGFHTNKDDTLLLKNNIYRQKLAEFEAKGILNYLNIKISENNTDTNTIDKADSFAQVAWDKATNLKIMDGTRPQDDITRQEIAVILDRLGLLK